MINIDDEIMKIVRRDSVMSKKSKYIGETVYILAHFTGDPKHFEVTVEEYDPGRREYLCSNETEEHFFYGWEQDIYNQDGEPLCE